MPVPSTIDDLSPTPGSNYPAGSESPAGIDDYLRFHAACIAQLRDGSYDGSDAVKLTGAQTIAGAKTFSSPIVGSLTGTATTATNTTRSVTAAGLATGGGDLTADRTITVTAATQAQAEAGMDNATAMTPLRTAQAINVLAPTIGVGQTWQDFTGSRTDDASYQNTTGKPIMVAVSQDDLSGTNRMFAYVSTDGSSWVLVQTSMSSSSARGSVCFIVPPSHYYRVNTSTTIVAWAELR